MSEKFVKVPISLIKDKNVSDSAVRIYCLIRSFADWETGDNCFPSGNTIAGLAGRCRKTVTSAVSSLKSMGYINVESGGFGVSNRYTFTAAVREQLVTHREYPATHDVSNQLPTPCVTGYALPRDIYQESFTKADNPFLERMRGYKGKWTHLLDGVRVTCLAYNC